MNTRPTRVVHVREGYDVYIGRPGKGKDGPFGNPFRLTREADRDVVLEQYRAWFLKRVCEDQLFRAAVLALRGRVLGCFCKPKTCHGDIIVEWIDAQPLDGRRRGG
jgi:hypothetical protein